MKSSYFLKEKRRFHLGHWRLADHKRLSVLLLFFFILHGVAVKVLKIQFSSVPLLTSETDSALQVFFNGQTENSEDEIAFQLHYQDPSSVSRTSLENLSFTPRDMPLEIGLEPEPLTKILTTVNFLNDLKAPSLNQKAEDSLNDKLSLSTLIKQTNQVSLPKSGVIIISPEAASRLMSPLPVLLAQAVDQPLMPTVIRVGISPNGGVESALVESPSGNLVLDRKAVQLSTSLRFTPDFEKPTIWSVITFYWLQMAVKE